MSLAVLSSFPTTFDDPMPSFMSTGGLPPGEYSPSKKEFELRFVSLGDVARRQLIYDGWNRHRQALRNAGLDQATRQLLNGSYTTDKRSPGDIDIAVEVPMPNSGVLRTLKPDNPILLLLGGPRMKASFQCDAYPIFVLPDTDPDYVAVTVKAIEYWTKWFGTARDGTAKGRVWASTRGLK